MAIADALRPIEEAAARRRKAHDGRAGKLPARHQTNDRLAAAVGLSGRTLDKATAVVRAADADPEMYPQLEK